jgi:hypothetical protein
MLLGEDEYPAEEVLNALNYGTSPLFSKLTKMMKVREDIAHLNRNWDRSRITILSTPVSSTYILHCSIRVSRMGLSPHYTTVFKIAKRANQAHYWDSHWRRTPKWRQGVNIVSSEESRRFNFFFNFPDSFSVNQCIYISLLVVRQILSERKPTILQTKTTQKCEIYLSFDIQFLCDSANWE